MHILDAEWIEKCKSNHEYQIQVDNDCIFVVNGEGEVEHDFLDYGYHFAKELLEYIGCNVDFVYGIYGCCAVSKETNITEAAQLMGYEVVEETDMDNQKSDCNYAQVFPDDNKCRCMAYSYSKREDGLHWGHYPYCGDDVCPVKHPELLEGAVLEEIPAKQDKPRICKVLGVEVEETFTAKTPWGTFNRCVIDETGMAMNFGTNVICHIINHPECIVRKTRAEEKEVVEDSNLVGIDQVRQDKPNQINIIEVVRTDSSIEVAILPYKDGSGWSFVNLTKGHICSCKFDSKAAAMRDLEAQTNVISFREKQDKPSSSSADAGGGMYVAGAVPGAGASSV